MRNGEFLVTGGIEVEDEELVENVLWFNSEY